MAEKLTPLRFFEGEAATAHSKDFRKFTDSFGRYLEDNGLIVRRFSEIDTALVSGYKSWLANNGHTLSTANQYIGSFITLYNRAVKAGLATKTVAFKGIRDRRVKAPERPVSLADGRVMLTSEVARAIYNLDLSEKEALKSTRDLFVCAVLMGGLTFRQLAMLKRDALHDKYVTISERNSSEKNIPLTRTLRRVLDRVMAPGGEYMFRIMERKPKGAMVVSLEADYLKRLDAVFYLAGVKMEMSRDIALLAWISLARESGVDASVVASMIERYPVHTILKSARVKELDVKARESVYRAVANTVCDTTMHWYAMHIFEPLELVEQDISRCVSADDIETYYAVQEVAKRVGRAIKDIQCPVLKNMLFFRTDGRTLTDITRCVRGVKVLMSTGREKSSPAIIPDSQFNKFRSLVTHGADFVEVPEDQRFKVGDKVMIVEDLFAGNEADIVKIIDDKTVVVKLFGQYICGTYSVPVTFLQEA